MEHLPPSLPPVRRKTNQREAIRRAFDAAARPLSPQEALELARGEVPGLGIATVYRAIKELLESRFLAVVEVPGEPSRYERSIAHHHHHFHCRECRRLSVIHHCAGDFVRLVPTGYVLEDHELILRGLCAECAGKVPKK